VVPIHKISVYYIFNILLYTENNNTPRIGEKFQSLRLIWFELGTMPFLITVMSFYFSFKFPILLKLELNAYIVHGYSYEFSLNKNTQRTLLNFKVLSIQIENFVLNTKLFAHFCDF